MSSQSSVHIDHGTGAAEKSVRRRQCHWTAASCNSCMKQLARVPQAGTGAQPKRRYGLLGLMKRNKSEIGTHSLIPTMFKRFHAHAQQEVHPQPIAENGIEDDDHDDLFASPR